MNVTQAILSRKSVRAFLPQPVPPDLLRQVVQLAARAPSGGNLQPWRLFVLSGPALEALKTRVGKRVTEMPQGEPCEYPIYPDNLWEPYRSNRFAIGEQMYAQLGVSREDKAGRRQQFARNYAFFGAPAALFCYIDRRLGAAQWVDLGLYLQSLMLALREHGLHSCAQECWSLYHETIDAFLGAPAEWLLFCGLAVGYEDASAPVNQMETPRLPVESFATFIDHMG